MLRDLVEQQKDAQIEQESFPHIEAEVSVALSIFMPMLNHGFITIDAVRNLLSSNHMAVEVLDALEGYKNLFADAVDRDGDIINVDFTESTSESLSTSISRVLELLKGSPEVASLINQASRQLLSEV